MRRIATIVLLLYTASARSGTPTDVVLSDIWVYHWEPWFTFSMLRITAAPRLDAATLADVGAYAIGGKDATEPARWLPRWGVGFQVTTNRVLLRLASDWAPKAAPTLTIGLGYAL